MSANIKDIVNRIAPLNNKYRDLSTSIRLKLEALWEIGDILVQLGVTKPHMVGWAVQRETRGLIKRPTIFRSHKVRTIWDTKENLIRDFGELKSLSNLIETLPLIDPAQEVRRKLSQQQLAEIYKHACYDPPVKFKSYIKTLKQQYAHDRLGHSLNRDTHLKELGEVTDSLRILISYLNKIISDPESSMRQQFRNDTSEIEIRSFSNMCISLTTKDNLRLYKNIGPIESSSKNKVIRYLYDYFHSILNRTGDNERARLRRIVSAEVLAQFSDMISSLLTEDGVKDFKVRQKIAIKL
jgi:hypothetical protein